jgi:hypothetical protein
MSELKLDSMLLNFRGEKIFLERHRVGNLRLRYEIIFKEKIFGIEILTQSKCLTICQIFGIGSFDS